MHKISDRLIGKARFPQKSKEIFSTWICACYRASWRYLPLSHIWNKTQKKNKGANFCFSPFQTLQVLKPTIFNLQKWLENDVGSVTFVEWCTKPIASLSPASHHKAPHGCPVGTLLAPELSQLQVGSVKCPVSYFNIRALSVSGHGKYRVPKGILSACEQWVALTR